VSGSEAAFPTQPQAPAKRRWISTTAGKVTVVVLLMLAVLAVIATLLAVRYYPYLGRAQETLGVATDLSQRMRALRIQDVDRRTITTLRSDLHNLDERLMPFRELLRSDPLVGLLGGLPVVDSQVTGGRQLLLAADDLLAAGDMALGLGDRFVTVREEQGGQEGAGLLAQLVALMGDSTGEVDQIADHLARARTSLAAVPPEAIHQIRQARNQMAAPIEQYAPVLDDYRELDDVLPAILGRGGARRYLVLAENPAELRPIGGYAGTIGEVRLKDGALAQKRFRDVFAIYRDPDLPYIEPPESLRNTLLGGKFSWRSADAGWSPDFPTSAQDALMLYANETGDEDFDGVIAITTYALDRLLQVTGPIAVPGYDVTVKPGDVTWTILANTRTRPEPGTNRKAILDALADTVLQKLYSLPPERWMALFRALEDIGQRRLAMAWFKDPAANQILAGSNWSGAVRQDPGDYLYVVDASASPASKYSLVVTRSTFLNVKLDAAGTARNTVRIDWQNDADKPGPRYQALRDYAANKGNPTYGVWARVLAPANSELLQATGRGSDPISGVEEIGEEAGRASFGNGLLIPPGNANLTYQWEVPGAAVQDGDAWVYTLTIQKQPGMLPEPFSLRVALPEGATLVEASDGAEVTDGRVTFTTTLTTDLQLTIRYRLP
jgi:hypothetical protein